MKLEVGRNGTVKVDSKPEKVDTRSEEIAVAPEMVTAKSEKVLWSRKSRGLTEKKLTQSAVKVTAKTEKSHFNWKNWPEVGKGDGETGKTNPKLEKVAVDPEK